MNRNFEQTLSRCDSAYYEGTGIEYQGLQLWDHPNVKILPYLGCANQFIDKERILL